VRRILLPASLALALFAAPSAHAATVVFSDDFEGVTTKAEWSGGENVVTPNGSGVLGESGQPFANSSPTLTLTGLPAHTTLTVTYQYFMLLSNDGDEHFTVTATGGSGPITQTTSFGAEPFSQCYPGNAPCAGTEVQGGTGRSDSGDLLGYGCFYGCADRYDLGGTVGHSAASTIINFDEVNSQGWADEGWVLDNVTVTLDSPAGPACTITGTSGADRIRGTSGDDVICGLSGNDVLDGRGGNDTIYGDAGSDTLIGKTGNDTLVGGTETDLLLPGSGNDSVDGGDGTRDRVLFSDILGGGVHVLLASGVVSPESGSNVGNDTLTGVEQVFGSTFNDVLIAEIAGVASTLKGGAGDDQLDVDDGDSLDTVVGNQGSDTCTISAGDQARECEGVASA
jgi:Ca2+-binding RTX toxin-like protein